VRILAATNRDLEKALEEGRFREDLYYRLKVVSLSIPPLRNRGADIPLLAEHFLSRFSLEMETENPGITEEAKAELLRYAWPGNVRELANTIQKAVIFSRGCPIGLQDVTQVISEKNSGFPRDENTLKATIHQWVKETLNSSPEGSSFDSLMESFEKILVSEALDLTKGNRSRAAKLLGMSRPTLLAKIEKYQIEMQTSVTPKPED
jgi:DNA-binding NtrC family response regulator